MKRFAISVALTILVAVVFVIGLTSQNTAFTIGAFCAWTPLAWFTGAAYMTSGYRLGLYKADTEETSFSTTTLIPMKSPAVPPAQRPIRPVNSTREVKQ